MRLLGGDSSTGAVGASFFCVTIDIKNQIKVSDLFTLN
jgi:hypothetical protein